MMCKFRTIASLIIIITSMINAYVHDFNLYEAFLYMQSGGHIFIQFDRTDVNGITYLDTAEVMGINPSDTTFKIKYEISDTLWCYSNTEPIGYWINSDPSGRIFPNGQGHKTHKWSKYDSYYPSIIGPYWKEVKLANIYSYSTSREGEYKEFKDSEWYLPDSMDIYDAQAYTNMSLGGHLYVYDNITNDVFRSSEVHINKQYNNSPQTYFDHIDQMLYPKLETVTGYGYSWDGPFKEFVKAKERLEISSSQFENLNDSLINDTTLIECREKKSGDNCFISKVLGFNTIDNKFDKYLQLRDCFKVEIRYPGYPSKWKRVCDYEFRINEGDWFYIDVNIR